MKKIFLMLILLGLITGCGTKVEDSNAIMNNHENVIKEQTVNQLTMSNVSLRYKEGVSTLTVTVTNTSSDTIAVNQFNVVLKTENGSIITTLNSSLGEQLEGNASLTLTITSDIDLSEAYSLEYQIS